MARPFHIETAVEKAQRIRNLILVRAVRTALGLSQRDLATIVGVHFSSLARFESGHMRLKQEHVGRILDYFRQAGVSFEATDQGSLNIHLSAEGLNDLAHVGHQQDQDKMRPGFRL